MKKFRSLNNSFKTGILTLLASFAAFIATIFLFFIGYMDIPLGIILGGVIIGGLGILTGVVEKRDEAKKQTIGTIIMIIVRFAVIVSTMVIIAMMNHRWNMPYFNLFSFVGVYTVSIIITMIIHIKERRQGCNN